MGFLGVYKAIYDYVPQGESELAITDGDLLYVLEKSQEDDWWKAKKKASDADDDEPVGLIPNNYVEEAQPLHHARALFDYTRQTDEEVSFTENAKLEVFDTSDPEWTLVGVDGDFGFAPANYIEVEDETAPSGPAPPSLPRRPAQPEEQPDVPEPASPVRNPAAAIAGIMTNKRASVPQYTPEASDEDEAPTPSLPARPTLPPLPARAPQPQSRGQLSPASPRETPTSQPYSRTSHRDDDDDDYPPIQSPGGFHMYNINEMVSVMGKRKKMPTTLGVNLATGVILLAPAKARDGPEQKWTAEKMTHYSIEGKHVFIELVRPSKSLDLHAGAKDTAQEIVSALGELAGAVRAEGLLQMSLPGEQKKGQMLYEFMAQGDDEVTVAVGDEVIILDDTKSEEWWQVRRLKNGKEGVVPSSYVEVTGAVQTPSSASGINAGKSTIEQNRLEEERLAKESLKVARRDDDARGSEVGPGVRLPERGSSLSAQNNNNNHGQQRSRQTNGRGDGQSRQPKSSKLWISLNLSMKSADHKIEPDSTKIRQWSDRSKTFSVEAQFLGLKDGKINLHKLNGVKIAVPVAKMSVEDLEYVERVTGVSLDEDKPLSDIKKQRSRREPSKEDSSNASAGATIEKKPEYDWFSFFLSCDVAVGLCERYAQTFHRDSMDESVLSDVDATVLRTLGIREGDIIKIMRFLDKKFGRPGGKRNVSFGGEDVLSPDGESSGGLFSGPGGTLRNNTRKGRPAPAVQTNDVVDPKAFSQEPKSARSEGIPTPLASAPAPAKKDPARSGFDDDAWDVKPSKQEQAPTSQAAQPTPTTAPASTPTPQAPTLTGSMQELSLLSQPLEPTKTQPAAPAPQPQFQVQQTQPQVQTPAPQTQPQPPQVTPSFFQGIGGQQTGLPQQQQNVAPSQFTPVTLPQNIARQRPTPPQQLQSQNQGLMIPAPPTRPLSAPQVNQSSSFALPPLQPQITGMPTSSFQQIAPPGQSLDEIRMRQQFTGFNGQQNPQNIGMMPQPTGFQQFNGIAPSGQPQQTGFQYPMQTGIQQQQFMNGGGPFADPRPQQFQPLQQQPTGFQSSFGPAPQQFSQPTGVNAFLPPPLQPTPTGIQNQNNFSSFIPPPVPPIPQQQAAQPLIPQKTGPPPPVRFGVSNDAKKLMPQPTGRRANLSQATPQNPFGF
ncbi:hypothetical protein B0O99DRAFT_653444 [Bisporella sp. PMI_857]|nr:hypothetical protein B0O99DRAFT_653444 [Bisporella sp. PMI_857]